MKRRILALTVFTTLLMVQSCMKDSQYSGGENTSEKVQHLNVPANFDWGMTKAATCVVNSSTPTEIAIYLDEACEEDLLATATAEGNNVMPLSVPAATTKLYVKYTSAPGLATILEQDLIGDTATFSISDAAKQAVAATSEVEMKEVTSTDNGAVMSYPANWGTVMFEDLFPSLGDYDFNDFVASYLIAIEYVWKDGKYDTQHTKNIRVQLRLRAIGGSQSFTPYVRVMGLNKSMVSLYEKPYNDPNYPGVNPKIMNNTTDGVKVSLANSANTEDLIVEFKNLNSSNPFKVPGASFYNTSPGNLMRFNQLTEVDVYLALNEEVAVKDLLDDKIDIFLTTEDKRKEIHLRGFFPVFSEYDFSAEGVHQTIPYASKANLVWGVKVPKGQAFLHAAEKINFCDAYGNFAEWATSGGNSSKDWYNDCNTDNVVEWAK